MTLGCIAHHDGKSCVGGALVGSDNVARWFAKGQSDIDLRKLPFAKNPALGAYFNSLVNLGVFVTEEAADPDDDTEASLTFDDLELSTLGKELAQGYGAVISRLDSVRNLSDGRRRCTVRSLGELGKRGGLCELAESPTADRTLLRDIFLARAGLTGDSHGVRRQSLLLIIELSRQLSAHELPLDEQAAAAAFYFGEVASEQGRRVRIKWPSSLHDIATRWRMFYFHHYMSVALEGMFAWVVTQVAERRLTGASVRELAEGMDSVVVRKALAELLSVTIPKRFGQSTPSDIFQVAVGVPPELGVDGSRILDEHIRLTHSFSEARLESAIRSKTHPHSPTGLATPMLLLVGTLARYKQWEETNYGHWLAGVSNDPYLDLVPPVLTTGLDRRFGQWWKCGWQDLAEFVLSRYVVQQHQAMSYEKTVAGDRCLLQVDGNKVMSSAAYDKIGMGNPRFRSALRILKDLGLLTDREDGITVPTSDGLRVLEDALENDHPE